MNSATIIPSEIKKTQQRIAMKKLQEEMNEGGQGTSKKEKKNKKKTNNNKTRMLTSIG